MNYNEFKKLWQKTEEKFSTLPPIDKESDVQLLAKGASPEVTDFLLTVADHADKDCLGKILSMPT
jgi:hypothetical protein